MPFATDENEILGVAVQSDGRIVVAGYYVGTAFGEVAVARYLQTFTAGTINFNKDNGSVLIYPNQVHKTATLEYSVPVEAIVSIGIYNSQGQFVRSILYQVNKSQGVQKQAIYFDNLASGNYFVRITSPEGNISIQVIK